MEAVVFKNVSKKFGEKVIFDQFSMTIEDGDYVAITGESGKGKTTMLNLIGMLDRPNSGTVSICGHENPDFSSRAAVQLRRHVLSYLFQNYGLIDTETVENNIKTALRFKKIQSEEKKQLISNALAQMGLEGYHKRNVFTLSGGEQQRVALAKIIAKSPSMILADEPTGSLDEKNRDYVLDVLEKFHKEGKTVIVVTHDARVASCAKKHISLQ